MALVDGSPGRRSMQRHEYFMQEGPEIGKTLREKRNRGGKPLQEGRHGRAGVIGERGKQSKSGGEEGLEVIESEEARRIKRDSF